MNTRNTVTAVIGAALVFGAFGYLLAAKTRAPSEAQIGAAVESYLNANPEMLVVEGVGPSATTDDALSESQTAAVSDLIGSHLIANPEIVRDAINELQRREMEAELAAQTAAISEAGDLIFSSSRQAVIGNPDGEVTLVEFFDYNCGYCKRAHADMKRLIDEDPSLRVVLKEFPVLGEASVEAAHVSAAVNIVEPDKYSDFHDALLLERGRINGDLALAVAESMGLDMDRIRELIPSDEVKATIDESYQIAETLSLTGTPSYVTASEVVVGAVGYETLKAKIEESRAAATQ